MTTKELSHRVIKKIKEFDDENLLHDLIRIIEDSTDDNAIFLLSENHKKAINQANGQVEKGDYLANAQSKQQIDECLNK